MATLFEVTYESNNLNEHDRIYSDGGRMGTSAASALGGSNYGCEYETDGATVVVYGQNDFVLATNGYSIAFRIDPNSIAMGNGDLFTVSRTLDESGPSDLLRIDLYYNGSNYQIRLVAYTDAGGTSATGYYTITDAEHEIEGVVGRASNATASDGSAELYIDSVSQEVLTGIDNYDLFPLADAHRIGMATGLDATTDGTIYIDAIIADDTPVAPSPPTPPPAAAAPGYLGLAQKRPSELIDLLRPDVQMRAEPNFAWKSLVSSFLSLPGLRGVWSMGNVAYSTTPKVPDLTGQGNDLDDSGTVTFGYENLIPYANFTGRTQHLDNSDAGAGDWADILGTETYVTSGKRGLTLGGWFYISDTGTNSNYFLVAKSGAVAANRAYSLYNYNDHLTFRVYDNTVTPYHINSDTFTTDTWFFAAGRFIPSNEMKIWHNGYTATNVIGIPAAVHDSPDDFTIGARSDGSQGIEGRVSIVFLSAMALSDAIINTLYEQSRVMFNVL